ncbi:MAG TPA: hypothetical protein VL092_02705 [Chitinophagaceae bacterium]|nr:hypothetical protein [Chitinophagaceae bacterium]
MKKAFFLVCIIAAVAGSCTKDYPDPVVTPDKNTWIVNEKTYGPTNFVYYDTAGLMFGRTPKGDEVTVRFRWKPKADGKYVLREKADEIDEMSISVYDSASKMTWVSTDDDGRAMKVEQFADITVSGTNVGVSFNNLFLKRIDNIDKAKVSVNIGY